MTLQQQGEYLARFKTLYPLLLKANSIKGFMDDKITAHIILSYKAYADANCPHSEEIVLAIVAMTLTIEQDGSDTVIPISINSVKVGDIDVEIQKRGLPPYPFDQNTHGLKAWGLMSECRKANIGFIGVNRCRRGITW